MRRRQFIRAGAVTTAMGVLTITGDTTVGGRVLTNGPEFEPPPYADWVPAENPTDPDAGVLFTHVDWETLEDLAVDEEEPADKEAIDDIVDLVPIVGLPLFGALLTPLSLFGILFYPFSADVLPDPQRDVDGIETATSTWIGDLQVFHGEYDPDVFASEYADGFDDHGERNEFSVFVAEDSVVGPMAYAVSEETLVVAMHPGDENTHEPIDLVDESLDRTLEERDRVVDEDDGRWLFESTGEPQFGFGGWHLDGLADGVDPDAREDEPDVDSGFGENPVYDHLESVVNTLTFTPDEGVAGDLEARFAGIYPEETVPSEDDVRTYLLGDAAIDHEISIDGNRVYADATFDEDVIEDKSDWLSVGPYHR